MTRELVITRALEGKSYNNNGQGMHTQHFDYPSEWIDGAGASWMNRRLSTILNDRKRAGQIDQVIFSFNTVIAWRDNGVWIVPAVRYSPFTSSRHQSILYKLGETRSIPADSGMEEYLSVLEGRVTYSPWEGKYGTYHLAA